MTLRLLLGCNSASLLGTASITLLWRVVEQVVVQLEILGAQVVVALEDCLHRLHLYHLVLLTPLLLALVERVLQMQTEVMGQTQ
jgi:hypothetical protein